MADPITIFSAPILVVDDDPVSRIFIEKALNERGFTHVTCVDDGLKAVEHLKQSPTDLVILDIHMEGMNGLDCCQWIRRQPQLQKLPVLMLTALTDQKLRFTSFEMGSTDFVSKPIQAEELYARVKVHVENRLILKSLEQYKERLDMELQSAYKMQQAILPSVAEIAEISDRCKIDIAAHLDTSSEIGGDFWGIKSVFPQQMALWMVDFSGHGVAAAMNAFRMQAYLHEHAEMASRAGDYLSHLNEKLLQLLLRGHFATMFYGIIDPRGNRLHYACACSPHPMILRQNGAVDMIDGSGTPLGICMQFYATQSVEFDVGDTLMLYSDALTETLNAHGEVMDEDRLQALLRGQQNATPAALKEKILSAFLQHSSAPLADDLTLLLCKRVS